MRCDECNFWTLNDDDYLPEDIDGICEGLTNNGNVTIYIEAGWDGGYVDEIETNANFFCGNFTAK